MVERQPSKLRVAGSNPVSRSIITVRAVQTVETVQTVKVAHVAQSAEHILGKDEVTGSIPVMGLEKKGYNLDKTLSLITINEY